MSQLGSTGATVSGNITAWNRTPGKPGPGTTNNPAFPSNRWPSNKGASNAEAKRDLNTDDHLDKISLGPSDSAPNLWPSLFDSQRLTADGVQVESTTPWTSSAFSGLTASNTLHTSSDGANPSSSSNWPMHSTLTETSTIPRAITGQQLINHSTTPIDSNDPSRRFLVGSGTSMWPMNSDSADMINDDSSQLSMALSKMNMGSTSSTGPCFQPAHDFSENSVLPPGEVSTEPPYDRASTSLDNTELEALVASDPEEAIRAIINTPKPWGVRPVDQSTPWDLSELACETASSPTSTDANSTTGRIGSAHSSNLFEGTQQARRIGGRELESNVWPSEPPNGTGIWEAYYENLGERTARWQQNLASNAGTPAGFPGQQSGFTGSSFSSGARGHDQHLGGGGNSFRTLMRPNMGPLLGNSGTKPHSTSAFHGAPSPTGSSRAFPVAGNTNPWPFPPGPAAPDPVIGGKGRWPNTSFNRTTGRHQPPVAHMLPGQGGSGLRWPLMNNASQFPAGWPLTDPRRPNMLPGNWSGSSGSGDQANYFGTGHPLPPPTMSRMCQPGNEFTSPLLPPGAAAARGGPIPTAGGGTAPNQAFRLSHSAFYPSVAQRAFLSPQQHSQQLQQQSVLRANAMRQLIQLGFPDDEVQAIFSDINTNVERALMDLRDRTCHPGLDEIIRSFATGNLMSMNTGQDDGFCADLSSGPDLLSTGTPGAIRSFGMRSGGQHTGPFDQSLSKSGNLPSENLDLSIHVLQQRETQVLQTIMQLQSKHQELTQRLAQIRSTNMPFGANPVMQELQLQAIQVASQIDAQHAQLKQVRSQAGMLKHLASVAAVSQAGNNNPLHSSSNATSAFTLPPPTLSGALWLPNATAPATGVSGPSPQLNEPQLDQNLDTQDSMLKLGSGSLMWETGPWSGLGPRSVTSAATGAFDSYSSSDRRWSSTALQSNRPNYAGALGDPRWSDLSADGGGGNFLMSVNTELNSEDANANRRTGSRSWLLAHNIPPHVSVSILKMAVSAALAKQTKSVAGGDAHSSDFELHPNMSARWVLIGLASSSDAATVQEYLESSGGEQNGAHYGSIKAISPADALLKLQDIQSLASRFKAFSTSDHPSARGSTQQPPGSVVTNFPHPSSSSTTGDYSSGDTINRPVGETN